mmetsp:Transcript_2092/g.13559  ORF Transcript_2092/g.13559 Transcript_2092/m.13559 type:complete len:242 (+) Transcript_2092:5065-5790(+)
MPLPTLDRIPTPMDAGCPADAPPIRNRKELLRTRTRSLLRSQVPRSSFPFRQLSWRRLRRPWVHLDLAPRLEANRCFHEAMEGFPRSSLACTCAAGAQGDLLQPRRPLPSPTATQLLRREGLECIASVDVHVACRQEALVPSVPALQALRFFPRTRQRIAWHPFGWSVRRTRSAHWSYLPARGRATAASATQICEWKRRNHAAFLVPGVRRRPTSPPGAVQHFSTRYLGGIQTREQRMQAW